MNARPSVVDGFVTFSGHFEGVVRTPYADILNLITVAIGDLIDASPAPNPEAPALSLPFMVRGTNTPATPGQIRAAWYSVKLDHMCAHYGWRYAASLPGNQVELSDEGVQEVVARKLAEIDRDLLRRFPDFGDWPADGQLATFSMAWACGSGFRFPRLAAALLARDFETAAKECHIDTDGPDHLPNTADDNNGVKPRNAANIVLYQNAAKVQAYKLDPEVLYYPDSVAPPDTLPSGPPALPDSTRIIHPIPDLSDLVQGHDPEEG